MFHRLKFLLPLIFAICACSGSGVRPASDAVDKSALGQNRCVASGNEQQLFLVDWDTTDLSSFEAKAGRDIVFVHYENCQMKVLHGCSDDGIAGRYGSYSKPHLTSGGVEKLHVSTVDDLYAKLPLGVVSFGGEVQSGKTIDLEYYVSGVVNSTRAEVYRDDIKGNSRCEGATHFVYLYSLGAFMVGNSDALKVAAGVSSGVANGGVTHQENAQGTKRAGDLASCTSFEKLSCRAPIRVHLRAVAEGARPAQGTSGPPADTSGQLGQAQSMMNAVMLRNSAEQKLQAGDANGCLQDIDRALGQDRTMNDPQLGMLRARCEMRSGKCEEGKKHYRESKAAWARQFDQTGLTTDASIAAEADEMAKSNCSGGAATGGLPPQMAAVGLLQKILQANATGDSASCVRLGQDLQKVIEASGPTDPIAKQASAGLKSAATCAGKAGKCTEAKALNAAYVKVFFGDSRMAESAFKSDVPDCAKK